MSPANTLHRRRDVFRPRVIQLVGADRGIPVIHRGQLQLDAAADAFLREIEVEGIRMGKRMANRSSAARFAIARLMDQMSAQDVAKALLSQAQDAETRGGRGRRRV